MLSAATIALGMYVGEPCRICGQPIFRQDVETAVFAGYSKDSKSRAAHKECWDTRKNDKASWAYPEDDAP